MGNCASDPIRCHDKNNMKDSLLIMSRSATRLNSENQMERYHSLLNYVSQRRWIFRENSFIEADKFFSYYKEYLRDQTFVSEIWDTLAHDEEFSSIKIRRSNSESPVCGLKSLVRTGIPLDKLRDTILEMFNRNDSSSDIEYECASMVTFAGHIPESFKNVPMFSYSHNIHDILPLHFLNEKGMQALKRIMWVYEKNVLRLEYDPLLSQVVALLLVFLTEGETYCIVREMLNQSEILLNSSEQKDGIKSLKWYLTLTKEEFEIFLESLSSFLKERSNGFLELWKHFRKINYDCNDLFWRLTKTLLLEYLPISVVLKIFMAYLNEGIKVYYRFTLAFLKLYEDEIIKCKSSSEIITMLKKKSVTMTNTEIHNLMKIAYSLHLRHLKQRIPTIKPITFHAPESPKIYLPQLSDTSFIANTVEFELIWEWLPKELKLCKPALVYSSKIHGWSLNTLYSKCDAIPSYQGLLILIKTTQSIKFGAFVDGILQLYGSAIGSIGSDESFVFQLDPTNKKYAATKEDHVHLVCDRSSLSIGSGNGGPAIYLTDSLLYGYSYRSETYDNEVLCRHKDGDENQFECYAVEVYLIV